MRVWLDAGQRVRRELTGAVRAAGAGGTGGRGPAACMRLRATLAAQRRLFQAHWGAVCALAQAT